MWEVLFIVARICQPRFVAGELTKGRNMQSVTCRSAPFGQYLRLYCLRRYGKQSRAQMMQSVQQGVVSRHVPAAIGKNALIGLSGDHFDKKGIVLRFRARLAEYFALHPGDAAFDKW